MLKTPIDLNKKRYAFETFIRNQNATQLLRRIDVIGYVGLDIEDAIGAIATYDTKARIYSIYPLTGGEMRFSNKIELGIALLRLKSHTD